MSGTTGWAAEKGDVAVVAELLAAGALVELVDKDGGAALDRAEGEEVSDLHDRCQTLQSPPVGGF